MQERTAKLDIAQAKQNSLTKEIQDMRPTGFVSFSQTKRNVVASDAECNLMFTTFSNKRGLRKFLEAWVPDTKTGLVRLPTQVMDKDPAKHDFETLAANQCTQLRLRLLENVY